MRGEGGGGSSNQDISRVISLVSMEPRLLVTTYHLTAKTSKTLSTIYNRHEPTDFFNGHHLTMQQLVDPF